MLVSDAQIRALEPKAKLYKHFFGKGLFVQVYPDGRKYVRVKYRFNGRETTYSVGVYPDVLASDARKALDTVKQSLREGKDPNREKREAAKLQDKIPSRQFFRLACSVDGTLTIETASKLIQLNVTQAEALRSFLAATPSGSVETGE